MELEPVTLRPGQIQRYEPKVEDMETVALRAVPRSQAVTDGGGATIPDWSRDDRKLGNVEDRSVSKPIFLLSLITTSSDPWSQV
jgi:hypothetical protein